jgi:NADPH:quinone reductase-like Zn-dependent oxidoreductase
MYAAVVTSFDTSPSYQEFPTPTPRGSDEVLVDVVAAGLHRRVRSQADGSHYTSTGELPLVPGIDGVARMRDGTLRYFALGDTTSGAMAEQTVIDLRQSFPLPEGTDPVLVAAAMNPAMSSWVALRRRITFEAGQTVLILGATGSSGQLAVQVAKRLGAGHVIAAGRDPQRLAELPELGADTIVRLGDGPDAAAELGRAAADVDVVIDYLWGAPAERAMLSLLTARADRGAPIHWVQVGSVAGPAISLPSAALRSTNIRILGSGQGSIPVAGIVAELPALVAEIAAGTFTVNAVRVPLARVESAWNAPAPPGQRLVFVP